MEAIKYRITPVNIDHVLECAENMRQHDRDEVMALAGHTPIQALKTSLDVSSEAWVGLADGKVLCIFGVAKLTVLGSSACPWMLTTNELPKHARQFIPASRIVARRWAKKYGLLVNYVDARYDAALRWAKKIGFTVGQPLNTGTGTFYQIEMRG